MPATRKIPTPPTPLLVLAVAALLAPAPMHAQAGDRGPETVTFTRRGTLVYTHAKHAELAECVTCHHESRPERPLESEYQKCDACHTADPVPPMKTSLRNAYHDTETREGTCYTCHKAEADKGVDVPMRCIGCHPREAPPPRR